MRTSLIMIGLKHHLQYRLGRINAIIQNTAVETVLQELSDCYVFACTVEWIGEEETPDDIDTVIKTLSSCIADYDV